MFIRSNLTEAFFFSILVSWVCFFPCPFTCGPEVPPGVRTGATPCFGFRLRAQAARIQPCVRVHTLFSGAPLGDPALQRAARSRPVRERRAGRGGDFPLRPDRFFPRPRAFDSFSAHSGGLKSARRSGSGPGVARPWPWIDFTVISFFFPPLRLLPRPSWENGL